MNPLSRLPGAYRRRMAKWFGRRPFRLSPAHPIISFTFDDFPQSALEHGGAILEQAGLAATYYASLGLMGQTIPTGKIFQPDDLPRLLAGGHELGCHTFHHHPAWATPPSIYAASVGQNAARLAQMHPAQKLLTHSYPISYPRPATKRLLAPRFRGCRGGGQTVNRGTTDLNYLSSFFLEQSRDDFDAVEQIISATAHTGGWLIFSTHDVCDHPSRFGCTPAFFDQVVACSLRSGAIILPMAAALDRLTRNPEGS